MRVRLIPTVVVISLLLGGHAAGQKQATAPSEKSVSIHVGQSLDIAVQSLRQRKVDFHEGGLEISMQDADQSSLTFTLDHDHARANVFFSRSKKVITGVEVAFFPARSHQVKSVQSHISAMSIVLYPDSTYSVHFSKPRTLDQILEAESKRPKSVYPVFGKAANTQQGKGNAPVPGEY